MFKNNTHGWLWFVLLMCWLGAKKSKLSTPYQCGRFWGDRRWRFVHLSHRRFLLKLKTSQRSLLSPHCGHRCLALSYKLRSVCTAGQASPTWTWKGWFGTGGGEGGFVVGGVVLVALDVGLGGTAEAGLLLLDLEKTFLLLLGFGTKFSLHFLNYLFLFLLIFSNICCACADSASSSFLFWHFSRVFSSLRSSSASLANHLALSWIQPCAVSLQ